MNSLRVRDWLMLLSGLLVTAMLGIGLLGAWQGQQMSVLLHTMYADRVEPLKQIKTVSDAYAVSIVDVVHKFADGSLSGSNAAQQLDMAERVIQQEWSAYTSTYLVDDEKALIARLEPLRKSVHAELPKLRQAFIENDRAFAANFRATKMYPMFDGMQGLITELVNLQLRVSRQINEDADLLGSRSAWTLLFSLSLATVASIALCTLIVRNLLQSLGTEPTELKRIANRVASGDLRPIQIQAPVPKGSALEALIEMRGNLSSMVGQIKQGGEGIASASSQIATGNADLSERTEEQAKNLQHTAHSMRELSGTVRNSVEIALQANQLASSAAKSAQEGGRQVDQVVSTMQDISASSKRIADIIGVIDSIAFQTNILALNAAVEAARAGEQGRGFAVVATEVRHLASRSASAAKEIKALISESVQKVASGTETVNEAGNSVKSIVDQVQQVSEMISQLSGASTTEAQGIEHVGLAIEQLDLVTQQNAALVEETAAAAESMRHQASQLLSLISRFQTEDA